MKIEFDVKMSVDGIDKEVVVLGEIEDCLKILITESLAKMHYNCEIMDIVVQNIQKQTENVEKCIF